MDDLELDNDRYIFEVEFEESFAESGIWERGEKLVIVWDGDLLEAIEVATERYNDDLQERYEDDIEVSCRAISAKRLGKADVVLAS